MRRRALVALSIVAPDYGRTCAIGDTVEMDERLPTGGVLGDIVRPEWFEDLVTADTPAMTRRRAPAHTAPVDPAKE